MILLGLLRLVVLEAAKYRDLLSLLPGDDRLRGGLEEVDGLARFSCRRKKEVSIGEGCVSWHLLER